MYLINHAKDRVEILKEAFRKTYRDPNFTKNTITHRPPEADQPQAEASATRNPGNQSFGYLLA